jgi:murein DD-endopeptidase MepM/ murein hydrolase activator NlpD
MTFRYPQQYLYLACAVCLCGCASVPAVVTKPNAVETGAVRVHPASAAAGDIHRVVKGETLWRIARRYGVDVDTLALLNGIKDSTSLEVGQQLRVPKASGIPKPDIPEDFLWPVKGRIIGAFGQRVGDAVNKGINIQPGKKPDVVASRSGTVVFYNEDFLDMGKTVMIDHSDGFLTVYGRNNSVFVKPGDFVRQGTVIATVGQAGRNSGTYLHFQIRKGATAQNPNFYLSW